MKTAKLRLGVNIDHIATVRNARGTFYPDPLRAAKIVKLAGADGITVHLREDRRHILESDVERIVKDIDLPVNLEMATTTEMQKIALRYKPNAVCLVPENRLELTTEGGLNVVGNDKMLEEFIEPLKESNSRVSLFIAPDKDQIDAASSIGASVVELHTGEYCDSHHKKAIESKAIELRKIVDMAKYAKSIGLEVHAGHGLDLETVGQIASILELEELNIGHSLVAESLFVGLSQAVLSMRLAMDQARKALS